MSRPFIVFLKNKRSLEFEYKADVLLTEPTVRGLYRITFNNGKSYNYGADRVKYYPLLSSRKNIRIYEKGKLNKIHNIVDDYGRYYIFRNEHSRSRPINNKSDIEICDVVKSVDKVRSIIDYFKKILNSIGEISFDVQTDEIENKNPNQISSEILLKALGDIDLQESRSAFSNYVNGSNPDVSKLNETLIYPFGCNESQKRAVETAFENSISVVEGPPGTGKTQTILNIIANLVIQDKTVAIVSNNNSAVFNVRDKLEKYGYAMLVASLGNNENKTSFFENIREQSINQDFEISKKNLKNASDNVRELGSKVASCFHYRNKLATLETKLSDARVELDHVRAEQPLDSKVRAMLEKKFHRNFSFHNILKLSNMLSLVEIANRLSIINKLRFAFVYGLFDFNFIRQYNEEFPVFVNHKFYELYIKKLENEILELKNLLALNNEKSDLSDFIEASKKVFNGQLFRKYGRLNKATFSVNNYLDGFDAFVKHYPVITSSTLSLHTSVPKGYLFDYLIIDEASQVDIIKSAVCFSCSRNAIIVGDSMQLTHIIDEQSKNASELFQDKFSISPAYDYVTQNILNSLKTLYGGNLKSVLLKEHYRCHPVIIGFCNKKYYNNSLVVMTKGKNHPFRIIETNIAGGRNNKNQRQVDETDLFIRENYAEDYMNVGVITPYRNHADVLKKQLPDGVEADTIHKFQGREKDVIVFNTVKNNISPFIDNPNLINVAVSRAVKEFIVVKPALMELPHGTNIGDLIRYICYNADPAETITKGSVRSVFDLLYKEYNKKFTSFISSNKHVKGSAAEVIIYNLLKEDVLLKNSRFSSIDMVREYRLRDLVRNLDLFSHTEKDFIRKNSRIDFLLYNKIDKSPVLAIEVDGVTFHDNELQQERDKKKNHILNTINLPLIRLSTDGHSEKKRIVKSLDAAMRHV